MDNSSKYAEQLYSYFNDNLSGMLKKPNTCLRYPFVDPGSIYDGNLWDWDSFWAVYSLFAISGRDSGSNPEAQGKKALILQHAKGNIYNFFDFQMEDGYIPMMVEKSDLPEPYLIMKHREGAVLNMHKPFLCQQICLISGFCSDFEWARPYSENLIKYFRCYDRYYFNENCRLYVWADDVMIGMDNDPASFGRPRFSTANIFLNSFMVRELKSMAVIMGRLGNRDVESEFNKKAAMLTQSIQQECWDKRDEFFYSVDVDIKTRAYDWFHKGLGVFWKTLPIKIRVWSGFLPMWTGFATKEQAEALVKKHILDEATFNSPYGPRTLSRDEKMYDLSATNNPSNWLGPIWIIANYIVFRGLMNYGYTSEAREVYQKTLLLLGEDLERTGTLHEYYVPETGEPVMNGGFMNWNMLIVNMEDELSGRPSMDSFLPGI